MSLTGGVEIQVLQLGSSDTWWGVTPRSCRVMGRGGLGTPTTPPLISPPVPLNDSHLQVPSLSSVQSSYYFFYI